jgi:hypothetical protein
MSKVIEMRANETMSTTVAMAVGVGRQTVKPASMAGICPDCQLTFDLGTPSEESVKVAAVTDTTFTAIFQKPHAANSVVIGIDLKVESVESGTALKQGDSSASIAASEIERIELALQQLVVDPHAPREITVKVVLNVHREYPQVLYKGKENKSVANEEEKAAAEKDGFGPYDHEAFTATDESRSSEAAESTRQNVRVHQPGSPLTGTVTANEPIQAGDKFRVASVDADASQSHSAAPLEDPRVRREYPKTPKEA